MSESKHTPGTAYIDHYTDWIVIDIDDKRYALAEVYAPIARSKGRNGTVEAKANAARFAQCWNEYDQLKAELATEKKYSSMQFDELSILKARNRELAEVLRQLLEDDKSIVSAKSPHSVFTIEKGQEALAKYNSTK